MFTVCSLTVNSFITSLCKRGSYSVQYQIHIMLMLIYIIKFWSWDNWSFDCLWIGPKNHKLFTISRESFKILLQMVNQSVFPSLLFFFPFPFHLLFPSTYWTLGQILNNSINRWANSACRFTIDVLNLRFSSVWLGIIELAVKITKVFCWRYRYSVMKNDIRIVKSYLNLISLKVYIYIWDHCTSTNLVVIFCFSTASHP